MSTEKNDIEKYMKLLNIKCSRCLDTKILWVDRKNVFFARLDGGGDYDIFNCDRCSNSWWNRCSRDKEIWVNNIRIFHVADGDWHVLETLKKLVKPILDKQKEDDLNNKINILTHENNERESEQQQEYDNNPQPLWLYYKKDNINKEIKSVDIEIEIGKIANRVYEVIKASNGDITEIGNLINELKMDLKISMESSTTNKKEIKQFKDANNKFTYVIFTFSNEIIASECECYEWCGFSSNKTKYSLDYVVYKPKNKAAQTVCDNHMSKNIILH